MTLDDTATQFLRAHADGGMVADGWLYARALQQSRLDYTPESLTRLDDLLRQVRERLRPSAAHLAGVRGRNFMSLLAFYLGEMLRRRTGAHLVWHDRESALRLLPPGTTVPELPCTRLLIVGTDQGAAFWPLSWVEAQLLPDGQRSPAQAYLDDLVRTMERDAPMAWWLAVEAAGRLASWQMMHAAHGRPVTPAMLDADAPQRWQVLAEEDVAGAALQETLDDARERLEANPGAAAWQVLAYDGFVEQRGARTDAIIVVLCTYGERPLRIKLAFEYLPAAGGVPFAILQTRLREASVANDKLARLQAALDRGVQSVAWPAGTNWNDLRATQA